MIKNTIVSLCLLCGVLAPFSSLMASTDSADKSADQGIIVHLKEPEYSQGVLKTDKGGVIKAPNIRLQARNIVYSRASQADKTIVTVEAEGDLLIEFGEYIFVGDRLEYNFNEKTGVVYNGRSSLEPWFFGGQIIRLEADGSYFLEKAFVTTSENYKMNWEIAAEEASINDNYDLKARNVQFRFFHIPLLWLPSFKTNLNSIFDTPIRYSFRWGGSQGPRGSFLYNFYSRDRFKAFFRFDVRFNRGIGLGFETDYKSQDRLVELETINYIAQDSAITHPHEHIRYRFQGVYNKIWKEEPLTLNLTWDKLSDNEMATDYRDRGLELDTAGRTQLHIRHEEKVAITNFYSRVRVNPFQTVKQELPSIETHFRPINVFNSGVISDARARLSYLDFQYGNNLENVHDYHSGRFEIYQKLYRTFRISSFNIIPEVGGNAIFFTNSPESGGSKWLAFWKAGCEVNSRWYRCYDSIKHVMLPYARYQFISYPTTSPQHHYIFDIQDGWYRLNQLTLGLNQSFYRKTSSGHITRLLEANIYSLAFFKTRTIPTLVPKIYSVFKFNTFSFLHHSIDTGWDFQNHCLDHLNILVKWTLSQNAALAAEYRQRSRFDWRKADHTNYIIDSFRSVEELSHSQLSDRRDTLLLHFYYRLNPKWAVEVESRHGWNRLHQPRYNEFEIDLLATLQSACHLKLSYRYREEEKFRLAVNFNVGLTKPDKTCYNDTIPYLEF